MSRATGRYLHNFQAVRKRENYYTALNKAPTVQFIDSTIVAKFNPGIYNAKTGALCDDLTP